MKRLALILLAGFLCVLSACTSPSEELLPPNVLWITSEDNSPLLGCYGDDFATTPNLDNLASEGILYTNAVANAPVCAPARCTLISGVFPPSMGTENMRSSYSVPDSIRFYAQYLKDAGYYCTNNVKTDYNRPMMEGAWDEVSREAHYKNRKENQPFFAIFNTTISHESCIHKSIPNDELRHKPEDVKLPPHHPDTPGMRHDWAQYYDKVEDMDAYVGAKLKELEELGLADNTIVFYYADHGGVVARSKRFLYETGVHVPMIVRIPEKYKHLTKYSPGSKSDELVSFVDLPSTLLNLCGLDVPEHMQGITFLGENTSEPRDYVQCFRGRMDERIDLVRAVRNKQYKYIRNYMPHRIYAQYIEYLWRAPSMKSWEQAYLNGECNEVQSRFFESKPYEELYDFTNDPYEVNNLAADPQFATVLDEMRIEMDAWQNHIYDAGFIPEGEIIEIAKEKDIYNYVRSDEYNLPEVLNTAQVAAAGDVNNMDKLIEWMGSDDKLVRYWAATGCLILGEKAMPAKEALMALLDDECPDVRITAGESLYFIGEIEEGISAIEGALKVDNLMVRVHALNSLAIIGDDAKVTMASVQEMLGDREGREYDIRAGKYLLGLWSAE